MRFNYYPDTDSLYIDLKPGRERKSGRTVIVSDEMNINVDENGTPVGIELYQYASKIADLSKLEADGPVFGLVRAGDSQR